MRKFIGIAAVLLVIAGVVGADVSVTEHRGLAEKIAKGESSRDPVSTRSTGSISLVDASGLEYFINTDITFSTTSSASGAASEASYTQAVAASTSGGGTTMSTLNDAFDGYNTLVVDGTTYNENGPATLDSGCANRQVLFPVQTIGSLVVSRRVFVPSNDEFIRWMNILENPTGSPVTVTVATANNLGSDSNTVLDQTSDGDSVAETTDHWLTSYQNYSVGGTSPDPRLGHVLSGPGAAVGLASVNFTAAGENNPDWSYSVTVPAGGQAIIVNFATGQPSRAAAAAKAAELATLPANAVQCISAQDQAAIVNFTAQQQPTPTATPAEPGIPALGRNAAIALIGLLAAAGLLVLRRLG